MRMIATFGAVLAVFFSPPAFADKIDKYVEQRIEALHVPGLALAIVKDGDIIKSKGFGLANLETGARVTPQTRFEIGSLTKQFTAFVLMTLVEEGKVGLDDPLRKYYPDAPARWDAITIRHALHHMSGIRNHVAVPGWMGVFKTDLGYATSPDRDALQKLFYELPSEFAPGESWAYDNTGYILIGWIIEDVGGAPLFELMRERIFAPLGMTATGPSDQRAVLAGRADGYEWVGDHFENRPALPSAVARGAGALVSTIEDLTKWERALSAHAILSPESYAEIEKAGTLNDGQTPPFDYGFGWFISGGDGARIIQHGGGTPGFASISYRYPDHGLSIIALTNHADRVLDTIAVDIAGLADKSLLRIQSGDADSTKTEFIREIVGSLFTGARNRDRFTDAMNLFLDSDTGKGFWLWYGSIGALEELNCPEVSVSDRGELISCRIVLGGEPYWLSVRLAEDEKVAQIALW